MKRIILGLLAITVLYSCSSKPQTAAAPPAPSLPVATIVTGTDTTYQEYPASIEGAVNVEIRPQVSGALDKVFVDEGAFVKAGEPIFKINDLPYRAALNNAVANQHAMEAAVANAQLEIDKLTPLVQNKVVSDYQLKTAKAAYDVAKANELAAQGKYVVIITNFIVIICFYLFFLICSLLLIKQFRSHFTLFKIWHMNDRFDITCNPIVLTCFIRWI